MQNGNVDKCSVCLKLVRYNQKKYCDICNIWVHFKCTNLTLCDFNQLVTTNDLFYCQRCISSVLLFNYIDEDFECINFLLNFFNDFSIYSGFVPNPQQLSLLNNNTILLDDNIDPDVNSYNSLSMSCKYYLRDELGGCIEKSHMTSNLSLIHINARCMGNKLEYIEILCKTITIILIS